MNGSRPLRIGLVSTEFFHADHGGFGGFGMATREFVRTVHGAGGAEVTLLCVADPPADNDVAGIDPPSHLHGARFVTRSGNRIRDGARWQTLRLDVLVTIDWSVRYLPVALALPRTPLIIWSRDPRPDDEWERIASLRLPSTIGSPGEGYSVDTPGLRLEARGSARLGESIQLLRRFSAGTRRAVEVAAPAGFIAEEFNRTYGWFPRRWWRMGTPIALDAAPRRSHPVADPLRVVWLGRLDPVKRPWVAWALAEARPDLDITVLGAARRSAWEPPVALANLHTPGHVDHAKKADLLAEADVLLNTSIHEALPVSMCEGLAAGLALVSVVDPDGLATRFGHHVANLGGDGLDLVKPLALAFDELAADRRRRAWIAEEGPRWVADRHGPSRFLQGLWQVLCHLGLDVPETWRGDDLTPPQPSAAAPDPAIAGRWRSAARRGRTPDVVVVGAARAATTSLHLLLSEHPALFVPETKEPRYFASDGHRPDFVGPFAQHTIGRTGVWEPEDYLALFNGADPDQLAAEVSPLYLSMSGAAERLAAMVPDAKLVVVVRDPVTRAFSQWALQRMWDQEPLGFDDALRAEWQRLALGWSPLYAYRERGYYAHALDAFDAHFAPDQIQVLVFEEVQADPVSALAPLWSWLGVTPHVGPLPHVNEAAPTRSDAVARAVAAIERRAAHHGHASSVVHRVLSTTTRWNRNHPALSEWARNDLSEGYRDDIARVESRLGRRIDAWHH